MSTILNVQVSNPHYIRFPMQDGEKIVTVHIATTWLKERAARDGQRTESLALLYSYYRDQIESAAQVLFWPPDQQP